MVSICIGNMHRKQYVTVHGTAGTNVAPQSMGMCSTISSMSSSLDTVSKSHLSRSSAFGGSACNTLKRFRYRILIRSSALCRWSTTLEYLVGNEAFCTVWSNATAIMPARFAVAVSNNCSKPCSDCHSDHSNLTLFQSDEFFEMGAQPRRIYTACWLWMIRFGRVPSVVTLRRRVDVEAAFQKLETKASYGTHEIISRRTSSGRLSRLALTLF